MPKNGPESFFSKSMCAGYGRHVVVIAAAEDGFLWFCHRVVSARGKFGIFLSREVVWMDPIKV